MSNVTVMPGIILDVAAEHQEWKQVPVSGLPESIQDFLYFYSREWTKKANLDEDCTDADEVMPGLWIGGSDAADDSNFIEQNRINTIVNMAREVSYRATDNGIKYTKIGIPDCELVNVGIFNRAADIINSAIANGDRVLVHCAMGISRSATAVIASIIAKEDVTFREALERIRSKRPIINPHHLLVRSLIRDLGNRFKL